MDVPVNATVECVDGVCGRSVYAIIDRGRSQVTHVVVKEGGLAGRALLVPVDMIRESAPDVIRLRCSADELGQMQPFVEQDYTTGTEPFLAYDSGRYLLGRNNQAEALAQPLPPAAAAPAGKLAVKSGATVEASDGRIGTVDDFIVDPVEQQITHLILRQGHLWGQRTVTIPAGQIERIENDVVYLKLDRKGVEMLPGISA